MSYYYKYNFISPEPIFAIVREEFKSYFDTGAVDDLLFPTWTGKCLNKLGRSLFYIAETILDMEDFSARLPDNFKAVREAWLCTAVNGFPVQQAASFYSQAALRTTIQITPITTDQPQTVCYQDCPEGQCCCLPNLIQAVYKTNNSLNRVFHRQYLLKPGNISVEQHCSFDCANFGSTGPDSFDIRDNKFVTSFRNGSVHLVFYANETDEGGYQLIPDNYRIMEYIEAFIKFKVMEQLSNQVIDETFNQIQNKLQRYEAAANEAYILAETEIKKQDVYGKLRSITSQRRSLDMYQLANDRSSRGYGRSLDSRYRWRRP